MIKRKNILKYKLFENPDKIIYYEPIVVKNFFRNSDAVAFGYLNDEMKISNFGGLHWDFIPKIGDEYDSNYLTYDEIDREKFKFPGRMWIESKIITFWIYPSKEELKDVLNDIKKAFDKKHPGYKLDFNDPDWYIEVIGDLEDPNDSDWNNNIENPRLVPLSKYTGSKKRSKEELMAPHLATWTEKKALKKKGWGKGFGSDLTAWDSKNPLPWRQAKYQESYQLKTTFNSFIKENIQFYYKKDLNSKFWLNNVFNERIRQKLLTIAYEFYNNMGFQVPIIDIILTGSLANYNWNKYSDLDVHIIVDFSKINTNTELVKKAVDNERALWNLKHNIRIKGHNVELYIQDVNEKHTASGQYSLLNNKWIIKPKWNKPKMDEKEINFKYLTYKSGIDKLEKISKMDMTPEIAKKNYLFASEYKKRIHNNRKIGLEKDGEFSIENLVFKKLRNNGDFGRLIEIINRFYDKIYTQ